MSNNLKRPLEDDLVKKIDSNPQNPPDKVSKTSPDPICPLPNEVNNLAQPTPPAPNQTTAPLNQPFGFGGSSNPLAPNQTTAPLNQPFGFGGISNTSAPNQTTAPLNQPFGCGHNHLNPFGGGSNHLNPFGGGSNRSTGLFGNNNDLAINSFKTSAENCRNKISELHLKKISAAIEYEIFKYAYSYLHTEKSVKIFMNIDISYKNLIKDILDKYKFKLISTDIIVQSNKYQPVQGYEYILNPCMFSTKTQCLTFIIGL